MAPFLVLICGFGDCRTKSDREVLWLLTGSLLNSWLLASFNDNRILLSIKYHITG